MRKLHLVGLTTDRDGLIFTARKGSKSGGYIVPLDGTLIDAVADAQGGDGDDRRPAGERRGSRGESALTPREMQARLRAGRTIAEVAAEAGVDAGWVARFAVPILAEQAQVVELARGLTYAKPRLGESAQPLGAAVDHNLADRGVYLPTDVVDSGWSAFQLHDAVWMVRFRYRSRNRDIEAQWELDVPTGRISARNRHASDLAYVDPRRRRRAPAPDGDEPVDEADGELDGSGPPARRRRATREPATPKPPARQSTAGRARARKPATRASGTRKPTGGSGTRKPAGGSGAPKSGTRGPAQEKKPAGARVPASKAAAAKPAGASAGAAKRRAAKAASARQPGARKAASGARKRAAPKAANRRSASGRSAATRPAAKAPASGPPAAAPPATASAPTAGTGPARSDHGADAAGAEPARALPAGGVRLAVAQVSTARLAASMANAERSPWAAATPVGRWGRPGLPGAESSGGTGLAGPPRGLGRPDPADPDGGNGGRTGRGAVPTFAPRPLPEGLDLDRPRTRRPPPAPLPAPGEPRPVSLPAPRTPNGGPATADRPRRLRLRAR